MKKLLTTLATILLVVVGAVVAPQAANAATDDPPPAVSISGDASELAAPALLATGQYEYICIGIDGSSWSLRAGEPTKDCHGSYLHKYINGSLVKIYRLSATGQVIAHPTRDGVSCLLAVAGGFTAFLNPVGDIVWAASVGIAGLGFITSCLA